MADDGTGGGNADGDKGGDDKKGDAGDDKTDDKKADDKKSDTEGRITVLAREKKELEDKLAAIDAEKKAAADAKLLEEGNFKKLLEDKDTELTRISGEHTGLKSKVEAYEALAKDQIAASVKAIGDKEKQKTVTDMLEGKPIEEQIKMLPKLLRLVGEQSSSFGGPIHESANKGDKTEDSAKQKRFDELLVKATAGSLTPQERQEKDKLAKELSQFLKS